MSVLAINGGSPAADSPPGDIFHWPVITDDDRQAVLDVLDRGAMSATDVTVQFEQEFADWHGVEYALACSSGTAALQSAMWAVGLRCGDELIAPSYTYWASALPALSLKATVVFADIEPDTLCLDPADIEHRITDHTRAIVVTHMRGYPAPIERVVEIADRHGLKVIEDFSQAHGSRRKGQLVGTFGDVAACSLMSGKSLPAGEGGMLITDSREIWERAIAWGHYARTTGARQTPHGQENYITDEELRRLAGLPLGGYKYRMHQMSSAMGRVQLRQYDRRMKEIDRAMTLFWDLLEDVSGIKAHRPPADSPHSMGGWFGARGLYEPEALGGVSVDDFCRAVRAEGVSAAVPHRRPLLHLHPVFNEADIYGDNRPTRLAHIDRDVRQPAGSLPVTERMYDRVMGVPWFKHCDEEIIRQYAGAYRKIAEYADEIPREECDPPHPYREW
ncbi:MAG: DegT/DnrJ/EryC1/StrS family aminotransferase [Armatimonadota bacterium]